MGLRLRAVGFAVGVLASVCAVAVPLASAAKDETTLVSRASGAGGAGGDADSGDASISGDGRSVAFSSTATNLTTEDQADGTRDVFVRDLQTNALQYVSRTSFIDGNAAGNENSGSPDISADGREVAFDSVANNIAGGPDTNSANDVYVRDLQFGGSTLVSRASGQFGARGLASSDNPSISADGNVVAFESHADNLSTEDIDSLTNIYVRDIQAQTTTLVSRADGAAGAAADGTSLGPAISADGRWVAFSSSATNLSPADANGAVADVFVRDLETNRTFLVSRQSDSAGGTGGAKESTSPSISGDGQLITFRSIADNLVSDDIHAANEYGIYVRDIGAGTTTLVSRQSASDGGARAIGSSFEPTISADGRFVAFRSLADNLSPDTGGVADQIFVRDLFLDTTTLASRASAADGGAPADDAARVPRLSADGRFVTFTSAAENLSAADTAGTSDVFVRDLGEPVGPSDTTAPTFNVDAKGKQKLGRPITLTVTTDEAADVAVNGTAKPKGHAGGHGRRAAPMRKGKPLKLGSVTASASAATPVTLKLKPSKRIARKLKKAARAKATIQLTATDAAANVTTKTLKVKLR